MNIEQYLPLARRTLKVLPNFRQHMIHMAMGIVGEISGELIDAAKKVFVYGKDYDATNHTEEVGDAMWYIANLLPDLNVNPYYAQLALDSGVEQGKLASERVVGADFGYPEMLLSICSTVTAAAAKLGSYDPKHAPGTGEVITTVQIFCGNLGVICGVLDIDPAVAMERNINKLAARYGDKYSDLAALNRDLANERIVLEGTQQ